MFHGDAAHILETYLMTLKKICQYTCKQYFHMRMIKNHLDRKKMEGRGKQVSSIHLPLSMTNTLEAT